MLLHTVYFEVIIFTEKHRFYDYLFQVKKGKEKGGSNFKKLVLANNVKEQTKQNSGNEYLVSESENKDVNFGLKDYYAFLKNLLKEKNKEIVKKENKICEL